MPSLPTAEPLLPCKQLVKQPLHSLAEMPSKPSVISLLDIQHKLTQSRKHAQFRGSNPNCLFQTIYMYRRAAERTWHRPCSRKRCHGRAVVRSWHTDQTQNITSPLKSGPPQGPLLLFLGPEPVGTTGSFELQKPRSSSCFRPTQQYILRSTAQTGYRGFGVFRGSTPAPGVARPPLSPVGDRLGALWLDNLGEASMLQGVNSLDRPVPAL